MISSSSLSSCYQLPDHYRPRQYAALWQAEPPDWRDRLTAALDRTSAGHVPSFFFRADDIGAGGRAFEAMCRLFRHHGVPLAMSVVPAWLSEVRKEQLFQAAPLGEALWGWHQHGWRHVNWQRTGKKSEFGEQRPLEKQWRDIRQGQQKMQEIFGDHFVHIFTPPWNRLCHSTIRILGDLGFRGVSLAGPMPRGGRPSGSIKNFRVQVDLHTRKAKDGASDFGHLLDELNALLSKREPVGVMIHHHRMTPFAFEFLNELLHQLKHGVGAQFLGFQQLVAKDDEE